MNEMIIAISIAIMIYAATRCKACMGLIPETHYSRYWKGLGILIVLFIVGYMFFEYALLTNVEFSDVRLIICLVLFLGSIYVVSVTSLSYNVFSEIAALQAEAKDYTDRLEEEVKKRTKELEELSITDNLTGLYNQRHFFPKLDEEIARAIRQKTSLYLMLFDVDGFKKHNDEHGHLAGDKVLQNTGDIIRRSIRDKVDSAFRYGGDEFIIVLPNATKQQALAVAKRIMSGLAEQQIFLSVGIVPHTDYYVLDSKGLLKVADQAMYEAKAEGGNRIRFLRPKATPDRYLRSV